MRQTRSRPRRSPAWSDDDDGPVKSNVGHRWTSAETRAIVLGRGGRGRARRYRRLLARGGMTYTEIWATNAARARWNKVRVKRGLPLMPLIDVRYIDTPRAAAMREKRELERRRRAYELDQVAASPQLSPLQLAANPRRGPRSPAPRGSA